ncbi:Glyoxalase/Bleomycin resistance protein/Dihydroxybiphenyl dioxygenase [Calocera viscosa TUFC12733]|uniref:Glyoxalase/Bleomycin resistance protein/Dihydroxybiphenyl dioxygenase n=1 Tax=Calocera viscosa (strain TUFC12733) TaxID=1330018 RepID=A0A167SDX9_CALVF|nr:Glyoxalase/Bleomycin resistance protein/Dihydroxybiphenyl dioxygenase [Calocera viscosa TUFC12733]
MSNPTPQPKPRHAFAHISLTVRSLPAAEAFYTPTLSALGYELLFYHRDTGVMGYALGGEEVLTLYEVKGRVRGDEVVGRWPYGTHIAFHAESQEAVLRWYAAALAHGGTDDGQPGVRDYYGPGYYAAFASDPDGHRLEAVAHLPVDGLGRVDFARLK